MSPLVELRARLRTVTLRPDTEREFDATRARVRARIKGSERLSMLAVAAAFLVAALALLSAAPAEPVPVVMAVVLLGGYTVLSRVELVLASGFAVPTQLVFVPLLFLLPAVVARTRSRPSGTPLPEPD